MRQPQSPTSPAGSSPRRDHPVMQPRAARPTQTLNASTRQRRRSAKFFQLRTVPQRAVKKTSMSSSARSTTFRPRFVYWPSEAPKGTSTALPPPQSSARPRCHASARTGGNSTQASRLMGILHLDSLPSWLSTKRLEYRPCWPHELSLP